MAKKPRNVKKYFWLLTIFFSLLTITGLVLLWSTPLPPSHHTTMMGTTMGDMMRKEVGPIALADLFQIGEYQLESNMASHHPGNELMAKTHFASTIVIVTLLPLIIGGLIFLLLLWV